MGRDLISRFIYSARVRDHESRNTNYESLATNHALLLLYYITDRSALPGNEAQRRTRLLDKISEAAIAGVDYIQLREKDLPPRELEALARGAVQRVRESRSKTRLLVNSRIDIALSVQADGVHLRSSDISAGDARKIWQKASPASQPVVAVSCHNLAEVAVAKEMAGGFVVFGPVFEKKGAAGPHAGIDQLRDASRIGIPVFALGGITLENAGLCVAAGARGIAGIRVFQENVVAQAVEILRQ